MLMVSVQPSLLWLKAVCGQAAVQKLSMIIACWLKLWLKPEAVAQA
jgi:hypothetical protein